MSGERDIVNCLLRWLPTIPSLPGRSSCASHREVEFISPPLEPGAGLVTCCDQENSADTILCLSEPCNRPFTDLTAFTFTLRALSHHVKTLLEKGDQTTPKALSSLSNQGEGWECDAILTLQPQSRSSPLTPLGNEVSWSPKNPVQFIPS